MPRIVTFGDLAAHVGEIEARVRDAVQKALPAAAVIATAGTREGFNQSRGPDGVPWRPLRYPRPSGGDKPLLNTGLLRSGVHTVAGNGELIQRASARGSRLHHYGGIVRPKRAKALAIPLTREAQRAGSPRNFPGRLFLLPMRNVSPESRGVLAELKWKGRGKKQKPLLVRHYVLRSSVTIPARPFVGFSRETREKIERLLAAKAARAAGKWRR